MRQGKEVFASLCNFTVVFLKKRYFSSQKYGSILTAVGSFLMAWSRRIKECRDYVAEQHKEAGVRELLRRKTRTERCRGKEDNNYKTRRAYEALLLHQ